MKMRLGKILNDKGWSQTKLADATDLTRGYVSLMVSGKKVPSVAVVQKIADALSIDVGDLYDTRNPIAVAGRVGAGAKVELVDAYEKGDGLYKVAAPDGLSNSGIVAVEVVGDSMAPIIQPGDVLFFSRHFFGVDENALGRVSICETEDGRALVKHITEGRDKGTFDLMSANNTTPAEYGARLKWAAPMRRHVPKEDVEVL